MGDQSLDKSCFVTVAQFIPHICVSTITSMVYYVLSPTNNIQIRIYLNVEDDEDPLQFVLNFLVDHDPPLGVLELVDG